MRDRIVKVEETEGKLKDSDRRRAIRKAIAKRTVSGWQPIETLNPDPDKHYLIINEEGKYYVAQYSVGSWVISCECYEGSNCYPKYCQPIPTSLIQETIDDEY